MNDYEGSVAQQDVEITTDVVKTAVVGDNYYKLLYITSAAIAPTLVTKSTYEDVINDLSPLTANQKAFMITNLKGFFEYANVDVYLIAYTDYAKYKYKAYFTYVEPEYEVPTGETEPAPSTAMLNILNGITVDKEFTALITDVPVRAADVTRTSTTNLDNLTGVVVNALNKLAEMWVFARGITDDEAVTFDPTDTGYSPALYQLGRTLFTSNQASGTPVGNNTDMVACTQADVLPTRSMDTSDMSASNALATNWFKNHRVIYFKPIGNSTGDIVAYGANSTRGNVLGVAWITAYVNYVVRVACAGIITRMNTFRDQTVYEACLDTMDTTVGLFVSLGRVTDYQNTAPTWGVAKALGNGESIVIPEAWEGYYVDNVRKVKISGTLYVSAT